MVHDARELLHGNQTALVIYTNGLNLDLDAEDGRASTAWWRIAERRAPDKVIIYQTSSTGAGPQVYIADYVDKERRDSDNRFKVYLAQVRFVGETESTWAEFAGLHPPVQNPIRYLSAGPSIP